MRDDLRTFGLDRISDLQIQKKKFEKPPVRRIEELFSHSFGIIRPEAGQPLEEIILSFTSLQGRYILSHPLHESQKVLIKDEHEIRIQLTLYITHDLVMELLSHGHQVKILQPEILRQRMLDLSFKG